ncbi:MAG: hypothetical protein HC769_05190 [Cyanobacteria bacterium CRU_2_1]|nr:hypothetical protein [Cyanobacteria bacterium CRU_2_1]
MKNYSLLLLSLTALALSAAPGYAKDVTIDFDLDSSKPIDFQPNAKNDLANSDIIPVEPKQEAIDFPVNDPESLSSKSSPAPIPLGLTESELSELIESADGNPSPSPDIAQPIDPSIPEMTQETDALDAFNLPPVAPDWEMAPSLPPIKPPIFPADAKPIGLDFSPPTIDPTALSTPAQFTPSVVSSEAPPLAFQPDGMRETETIVPPLDPGVEPPIDFSIHSFSDPSLDNLFAGESESLVARAVGNAEGTRSPDGERNPAYYGHVDPGNGAWNLGSFSYQHGAISPEEADAKQLKRLRTQAQAMLDKAEVKGIQLTLEEQLNGIDLANQAPRAVMEREGYVDWLAKAHEQGMQGDEAILWARVRSFIDPYTRSWNAPGLGNSEDRIIRDQQRRMLAISQAIVNFLQRATTPPTRDRSHDQAMQRSITDNQGINRLFAQPSSDLFEPVAELDAPDQEAIVLQQLFELDLSAA